MRTCIMFPNFSALLPEEASLQEGPDPPAVLLVLLVDGVVDVFVEQPGEQQQQLRAGRFRQSSGAQANLGAAKGAEAAGTCARGP